MRTQHWFSLTVVNFESMCVTCFASSPTRSQQTKSSRRQQFFRVPFGWEKMRNRTGQIVSGNLNRQRAASLNKNRLNKPLPPPHLIYPVGLQGEKTIGIAGAMRTLLDRRQQQTDGPKSQERKKQRDSRCCCLAARRFSTVISYMYMACTTTQKRNRFFFFRIELEDCPWTRKVTERRNILIDLSTSFFSVLTDFSTKKFALRWNVRNAFGRNRNHF